MGAGCIVVDFGTATTWDVVTPEGEYLGGVIAPGVAVSSEALYEHAPSCREVEIARPGRWWAATPWPACSSGLFFGYAGMVDAVIDRIAGRGRLRAHCLATGGLAPLVAAESRRLEETDELLTLRGLKILFDGTC